MSDLAGVARGVQRPLTLHPRAVATLPGGWWKESQTRPYQLGIRTDFDGVDQLSRLLERLYIRYGVVRRPPRPGLDGVPSSHVCASGTAASPFARPGTRPASTTLLEVSLPDVIVLGADGLAEYLAAAGLEVVGHGVKRREAKELIESVLAEGPQTPVVAHTQAGVLTALGRLAVATESRLLSLVGPDGPRPTTVPTLDLPASVDFILISAGLDPLGVSAMVDEKGEIIKGRIAPGEIEAADVDEFEAPAPVAPVVAAAPLTAPPVGAEPASWSPPSPPSTLVPVVATADPFSEGTPGHGTAIPPVETNPTPAPGVALTPATSKPIVPHYEPVSRAVWDPRNTPHAPGVVLFVLSRRGQVGKSSLSMRLAERAMRRGVNTVVVDGDFEDGDVQRRTRIDGPTMDHIAQQWDGEAESLRQFVPDRRGDLQTRILLAATPQQFAEGRVTPELYRAVIDACASVAQLVVVDCHPAENRRDSQDFSSYKQRWFREVVADRLARPGSRDWLVAVTSVDASVAETMYEWLLTLSRGYGINSSRIAVVVNETTRNRMLKSDQVAKSFENRGLWGQPFVMPFSERIQSDAVNAHITLDDAAYVAALDDVLYALLGRAYPEPTATPKRRRWWQRP